MTDARGAPSDPLSTLFGSGTCAGLSDSELLERFRTSRHEDGERAFEALVIRHGPLVLRICRQILDDPGDVHDAFQAVFLVLARRAVAIRKGDSLASWLHGVSVRVAARARAAMVRRRIRERRVLSAASAEIGRPGTDPSAAIEVDDGAAIVHEEVTRLPERLRTPIVLCYFEGLTHDEAAARLSWPVGTVRSRLARARDRLRPRLTGRGVTAPATLGPMAAWLVAGQAPARAATRAGLPASLPGSIARAAVQGLAGPCSSASIALAEGVLKMMMIKRVTLAAVLIASITIGTGTGALLIRRVGAQDPPAPKSAGPTREPSNPNTEEPSHLLQELLEVARERYRAEQALWQKGEIELNRFLQAGTDLEKVELLAAKTPAERRTIQQRRVNRLKDMEGVARAQFQAGRCPSVEMIVARQARLEAEFETGSNEKEEAAKTSLLRRVADLERKVEQLQKERGAAGWE